MAIGKNTFYNLLGAVIPIGVTLVSVPIYLDLIGADRFGVLALLWLFLGYFGFLDLGLSRATAKFIAAAKDSKQKVKSIAYTSLFVCVVLGSVGALIFWPVAEFFFLEKLGVSDILRVELQPSLALFICALPLGLLTSNLAGVLHGAGRFLALNLCLVSGAVLMQLLPLFSAIAWGPDLSVLIVASVAGKLLSFLILLKVAMKGFGFPSLNSIKLVTIKRLLQFGGWVTVSAVIGPLMTVADRFLIGSSLGSAAVSTYTIPFQLAQRGTVIAGAVSNALFPRLVVEKAEEAKRLSVMAFNGLGCVTAPLFLFAILACTPFLNWWISEGFAQQAQSVTVIVLIGFWINSLARIPYSLLQATGRPRTIAMIHALELAPYLVGLLFAMQVLGLVGVALIFTARVTIDCYLLSFFAGIHRSLSGYLVGQIVLMIGSGCFVLFGSPTNVEYFGISTLCVCGSGALAIYGLPRIAKERLMGMVSR